jgi:16S rRNA (adenine1518-N6/adenine1519-N6)-dimethyltransferase
VEPVAYRPKKSLGQNFLVDPNLQRKIVEALDPKPADEILEIGPGKGALTDHLVGRCRHLVLVELDRNLARELEGRYGERSDVEILRGDVLEMRPRDLVSSVEELKVVGNIPYNITTPILFHLLERPRPGEILLMVQREVADRVLAPPGEGEFGALSVGVRTVADVEKVLQVPASAFRPAPRVDSTVLRIRPRRPEPLTAREEEALRTLTRAAFQRRRKQFQTILRKHPDWGLTHEEVERVEEVTGFDLRRRPETLSPADFVRLSRFLSATS